MASADVTVSVPAATASASAPQPTISLMSNTAVLPSESPPPVQLDAGWESEAPDAFTPAARLLTLAVATLAVGAWWRVRAGRLT
jgi:hypothetical protein